MNRAFSLFAKERIHVSTVIEIAGCCVKMLSRRHVREEREPHDLHRVVRLIAVWIYGVVTYTSYKCNNRQDTHWSFSGQVGWYQNGMGATLYLYLYSRFPGYVDDLERIGRAAFFCSPI